MSKFLGIVTLRINGKTLRSNPGASLDVGGTTATTQKTARPEDMGFSEEAAPSVLDCEIAHDDKLDIDELRALRNVVGVFECDTGQTYHIAKCWLVPTPVVKAGAATPLKFEGVPATKL